MKIFQKVLTPDTLELVLGEFDRLKNFQCWSPSHGTWESGLTDPFIGQCIATTPSDNVKEVLTEELVRFLPSFDNLTVQYYRWYRNSGIAWHNDNAYKFGATIYLNTVWNIDYGGLFIWQDDDRRFSVQIPELNTMILNDKKQGHMVTAISNNVPYDRLTVQIWSK
jgi:hypothetical protein